MSIWLLFVRRVSRARVQLSEQRTPGSNQTTEGDTTMRYMGLLRAAANTEAGVLPTPEIPGEDGRLHGGGHEGRLAARDRRAEAELEGQARAPLRRQGHGHRR